MVLRTSISLALVLGLGAAMGLAQASQNGDPQSNPPDQQTQQAPPPSTDEAAPPDQPATAQPVPATAEDQPTAAADQPLEPPAAPPAEASTKVARGYGNASYPNEVPDGYRFLVTLADPLDTATVARGKHFKALLREPIVAPNGQAITGGHWITGHVSEVERGFNAKLLLSFDEIETPKGWIPLAATVVEVPSEHGLRKPGPEGEIERPPMDVKRALEGAGIGAAVGASTGEATGGEKGAAMGAASGAAAGAGLATLADRNILLDKGAQLVLRLDRSIIVP